MRTGSRKSTRTPPRGDPPTVRSRCRTLSRTPIAVIQSHGPSIRHDTMFATGVRRRKRPKCASKSSLSSTSAFPARTPKRRRNGRDRAPTRMGNWWAVMSRAAYPTPGFRVSGRRHASEPPDVVRLVSGPARRDPGHLAGDARGPVVDRLPVAVVALRDHGLCDQPLGEPERAAVQGPAIEGAGKDPVSAWVDHGAQRADLLRLDGLVAHRQVPDGTAAEEPDRATDKDRAVLAHVVRRLFDPAPGVDPAPDDERVSIGEGHRPGRSLQRDIETVLAEPRADPLGDAPGGAEAAAVDDLDSHEGRTPFAGLDTDRYSRSWPAARPRQVPEVPVNSFDRPSGRLRCQALDDLDSRQREQDLWRRDHLPRSTATAENDPPSGHDRGVDPQREAGRQAEGRDAADLHARQPPRPVGGRDGRPACDA